MGKMKQRKIARSEGTINNYWSNLRLPKPRYGANRFHCIADEKRTGMGYMWRLTFEGPMLPHGRPLMATLLILSISDDELGIEAAFATGLTDAWSVEIERVDIGEVE